MKTLKLVGKLGQGKETKVDEEDFQILNKHKWTMTAAGYVVRYEDGKIIWIHRQIMDPPEHLFIDHINHDKLDNRKNNLRKCTTAENSRNKQKYTGNSQYKGPYYRGNGIWEASIRYDGDLKYLGSFSTEKEAAEAYDYFAKEYFKEFANLNFPEVDPVKPISKILSRNSSSGYVGVMWNKYRNKWQAKITHKGIVHHIGMFKDKHDAARAYNTRALVLRGDRARINAINEYLEPK